jgi:hypothetical protein
LQLDLASNASNIVPLIVNGKDFLNMMSDVEERIKNEGASSKADPVEALGDWLRGEDIHGKVQ